MFKDYYSVRINKETGLVDGPIWFMVDESKVSQLGEFSEDDWVYYLTENKSLAQLWAVNRKNVV